MLRKTRVMLEAQEPDVAWAVGVCTAGVWGANVTAARAAVERPTALRSRERMETYFREGVERPPRPPSVGVLNGS